MIAADSSTWIAYLQGDVGEDVELLDRALLEKQALMVPTVLAELLSDPRLTPDVAEMLIDIPFIALSDGYWQRCGQLRAQVLQRKRSARLADSLIAQACLDRGVPLLTRDGDFHAFAEAAGLDLAIGPRAKH